MPIQQKIPPEGRTYKDRVSGLMVRQLTDYKAHSHHLYFTNPGWYDAGKRLLFASDRENKPNFFSVELATGEITQITDFLLLPQDDIGNTLQTACVNPCKQEAYVWIKDELLAIDLFTSVTRVIYKKENEFFSTILNCSADGKYVCTCMCEDLSGKIEMDFSRGYVGFDEYCAAKPYCKIIRIAVDGSGIEEVFGENYWINHINTSPVHPHLLTYCHEGHWQNVDHRIWGLDMSTGKSWKIRPVEKGETLGHEYWLADGESIGYHGHIQGKNIFGFTRYDNTQLEETPLDEYAMHFFSNNRDLILSDTNTATGIVALYRRRNGAFEPARTLCIHRCSSHIQKTHVHPRFTPDGKQVLYTSDANGYGNLFLVDMPLEVESLPSMKFKS